MKKRLTRLISGALMLCMIFSMVAPLTLFATDGETAPADPEYVFRETFSSGSLNTAWTEEGMKPANGLVVSSGEWYKCEDGALVSRSESTAWNDEFIALCFYDWGGLRLFQLIRRNVR